MLRAVPGLGGSLTAEFEVGFVGAEGTEVRASLVGPVGAAFELVKPVRGFPSYKRQRTFPGLWWSPTTGGHVGYESWLERDHLMLLDFDLARARTTSRGWSTGSPWWWTAGRPSGSSRATPRRSPRPGGRVSWWACELVGWQYRLVGTPERVAVRNVRWLAGYRHPRYRLPERVAALRKAFTEPTPLMDGVIAVGDPIAILLVTGGWLRS